MEYLIAGIISGIGGLFFAIVALGCFIFWLWMLIDAIRNPSLDSTMKIVWVLVILFLNTLGALIYFFAGRDRRLGG